MSTTINLGSMDGIDFKQNGEIKRLNPNDVILASPNIDDI
jgi:hypothetical protein